MKDKISIVTVNLNNKEGLEKTIESVVYQTLFDKIEYIIIDGESDDGSCDVIENYKDKLFYYVSEKDKGIYNAMNKGIDIANGKYTIFLNSGDYFHSNDIIEKIYDKLDKDIVYGDLCIHNHKNTFIKVYTNRVDAKYFTYEALPHEAAFIKTSLLKNNKYNENYKIISDTIFFYETIILKKSTYKHLDLIVTDFYLGGASSNITKLLKEKEFYFNTLKNMKTNKKSNLDIFVCSHNDFNQIVTSDTYTVINSNDIKDDVDLPLDDKFYSELYHFKYVHDNIKLKKYVGFCHYRRYFDFLDEIPDMNERFGKFDCIVSKPLTFDETIYEHYNGVHNVEDLELVGKIIKKKFPSYYNAFETFTNGNIFVPYNMFIMRRGDFKKYIKFVFTILDEYLKIVGTDINKRIEDNKDKYLKDFYPNNTIEYQYRIGGYLAERLTNVFLMKNFKKMKIYDVIITEEKYKEKQHNEKEHS